MLFCRVFAALSALLVLWMLGGCAPGAVPSDDAVAAQDAAAELAVGADAPTDVGAVEADAPADAPRDRLDVEPTARAEIDGRMQALAVRTAVSHTVGRTIEFGLAAAGDGYPEIRGALSFDASGQLNPCGVERPDPSTIAVRRTSTAALLGLPDRTAPASTCVYEVVARPRCPNDVLTLRFSADLVRGAERVTIRDGVVSAPVEFLLHGSPAPDGC